MELRRIYNISANEEIIIFKIETYYNEYKIPIIEYELFSENGEINYDLNFCSKLKSYIYIPVSIDEEEEYKYNPNDKYYNDRCDQHTTPNGTDISIYDRKMEFNLYHMSLCEQNCEYKKYNKNKKIVNCECDIKGLISNFDKKKLLEEFINIKKIVNIDIIICYKILLAIKGIIYNIGNYIIILILFISIIFDIYFCYKGYNNFISRIKSIKTKKNNDIKKEKKIIFRNSGASRDKKERKKYGKIRSNILQMQGNINNVETNSIHKIIKSKEKKIETKSIELNDYEINTLSYKNALKYDKRTFISYYISLINLKQLIIFSFFTKKDYNSRAIKIILFLFNFSLYYAINTLFFNDSTMHQIYIDHGIFNILYQLPQIIYSLIISSFINSIISFFSLTEKNVVDMKNIEPAESKEQILKRLLIKIKIKFIIFITLDFILLTIFWYYISVFCAVYKNTQLFLIKDSLISYSISMILPFITCLISPIFRYNALHDDKKEKKCLYKFSVLLQYI